MNLECAHIDTAALGPAHHKTGMESCFPCSNHEDQHPSLKVNTAKNVWLCGPCGKSGNAWRLAAFLSGQDPQNTKAVAAWLRERGLLDAGSNGNGDKASTHPVDSSRPKAEFKRVAEFYYSQQLRKVRLERPSTNGDK